MTEQQGRTLIYTILTTLISWMVFSGETLTYLHPKMMVFQIGMLITLAILTIYSWIKLQTKEDHSGRVRLTTIIPFLVLFIAIAMNPDTLSAEAKANKNVQLANVVDTISTGETDNDASAGQFDGEVNDFLGTVSGLYSNPNAYIGETVCLEGFVFRDSSIDENGFVLGRLLITCCVADASVAGIYIEPEDAMMYQSNDWLKVTGQLAVGERMDPLTNEMIATYTLENISVEEIEPLVDPYVYYTY